MSDEDLAPFQWEHNGVANKTVKREGLSKIFKISIFNIRLPVIELIIGRGEFREKVSNPPTDNWLNLCVKGEKGRNNNQYIRVTQNQKGTVYDKIMQIIIRFEQKQYKLWSNDMSKKIITIDDIPIRTNPAMQGIVFRDRDTHEEKLYCSHLGPLAVLVPPVHEGFIIYTPYDELYERYEATNRRAEPPGGLWTK